MTDPNTYYREALEKLEHELRVAGSEHHQLAFLVPKLKREAFFDCADRVKDILANAPKETADEQ